MTRSLSSSIRRFCLLSAVVWALATPALGQPQPAVTIELPPDPPMLGEDYTFTVFFENTGDAAGFGPYLLFCLPLEGADGGPDCDGASFVSAEAVFTNENLGLSTANPLDEVLDDSSCPPAEGIGGDPLCPAPLDPSFTAGCQLVAVELPFGSLYPDQPAVEVEVTVHVSELADADTALPAVVQGGFRFGEAPDGSAACLQGDPATAELTPVLYHLRKEYLGPEDETATGPSFYRNYRIEVDVADGQTVDPLIVTDDLPGEIEFLGTDCPLSGFFPSQGLAGGTVVLDFGSVTGTAVEVDASCLLDFWVAELDSAGGPVIGIDTCERVSVNDLRGEATWEPIDPRDQPATTVLSDTTPEDHRLRGLCLAIQKTSVQVPPEIGSPGLTPGDTLLYTHDFQVSDFVQAGELEALDVLPDGLDLVDQPLLHVSDRFGSCYRLLTPPNGLVLDSSARTTCGDGSLAMRFEISQAMTGCPGLQSQGLLTGGQVALSPSFPPPGPAATGRITFRARIRDHYYCPGPEDDGAVGKHDELINRVEIAGEVHDGATQQPTGLAAGDGSKWRDALPGRLIEKEIVARNGDPLLLTGSPPIFAPGNTVTFRIRYPIPASDAEALKIQDFLPSPVFQVTSVSPVQPPCTQVAVNEVCIDSGPTLPAPIPCVGTDFADPSSNSLCFDWGDVEDPTNSLGLIEIYFTLELSDEPFADGLRLTNEVVETEETSDGSTVQQVVIEQLVLGQPQLRVRKGVAGACCPESLIRGDFVDPGFLGRFEIGGLEEFPRDLFDTTVCRDTGVLHPPLAAQTPAFKPPGSSACPRFKGTVSSTLLAGGVLDADVDGIRAGDRLTFVLVVENLGTSPNGAFDVAVSDLLPISSGLQPTGVGPLGINLCVTDGAGQPLGFTGGLGGDQLSIELTNHPAGAGSLWPHDAASGKNLAVITYDLVATEELQPGLCVANLARVDGYAGVEGGPDHVGGLGLAVEDPSRVCNRPAVAKSIASTSLTWTSAAGGAEEVTIGEIVRFRLEAALPEGALSSLSLTDLLPPGLALAQGPAGDPGVVRVSVIADQPMALPAWLAGAQNGADPPTFVYSPSQVSVQGQEVVFPLGDVVNHDDDCDQERVILEFNAQVLNTPPNDDGDVEVNRGRVGLTTSAGPVSMDSEPVAVRIVEPRLEVAKSARVDPASPQLAQFEIRITNVGSTIAFDVEVLDQLVACLTGVVPSVSVDFENQPFGIGAGPGFSADPKLLDVRIPALIPGATAVVRFDATLCPAPNCERTRNSARVIYSSLPSFFSLPNPTGSSPTGPSGAVDGERDGSGAPAHNDYRAAASTAIEGLCEACIRGVKFDDLDCDGARDPGEPGLPGWTVELFPWVPSGAALSAVTGPDGAYEICGLRAGTHILVEQQQSGWQATFPSPFLPWFPPFHVVSLGVAEERAGLDFGNCRPTACVGGVKFDDLDGDGVRDPGEPGLPGWTIQVVDADGGVVAQAVTGEQGQYEICDLPAGGYTLREVVQPSWQPTAPATGSRPVGLAPGQTLAGVDFGNRRSVACIRGVKFDDLDGDGVRDPGEAGLPGWTVRHVQITSLFPTVQLGGSGQVQTGPDGSYEICGLRPALYVLFEEQQGGWQATAPPSGGYLVGLQKGQQVSGLDFGNRRDAGCIRGIKLEAFPQEELRCTETVPDWELRIERDQQVVATVTTDKAGQYEICGLAPGTYEIAEVLPPGWEPFNPGGDSQQVVLPPGGDVDALPFCNVELACISGRKWLDSDGDGVLGPGEPELSGWTIRATDAADQVVEAVTGPDGGYEICGLRPGAYSVSEVLQPGWQVTFPDGGSHGFLLQPGENRQADFGNRALTFRVTGRGDTVVECSRENGYGTRVTLTIEGGSGEFDCDRDDPGILQTRAETDHQCVFVGMPPGVHQYSVTHRESGEVREVEVEVPTLIELSIVSEPATPLACDNGTATVRASGGTPPYTLRWYDPADQTTPTATGLRPGTYKVDVTDAEGCWTTASVSLLCTRRPPDPIDGGATTVFWRAAHGSFSTSVPLEDGEAALEVDFDGGAGFSFGLAHRFDGRFGGRLGLEAGLLVAEADASLGLRLGNVPLAEERESGDVRAVYLGGSFHLFPERPTDLYFGPSVGLLRLPEPSGVDAQNRFAPGAHIGFSAHIGRRGWRLSGGAHYFEAEIDVGEPVLGLEGSVDVDLLTVELGLGFSY